MVERVIETGVHGVSVACGMFAVILLESDIWKAMSFALMVIAVVTIGYKEFFDLKEEENRNKEQK